MATSKISAERGTNSSSQTTTTVTSKKTTSSPSKSAKKEPKQLTITRDFPKKNLSSKNEKDFKLINEALNGSQKAYEGLMDRYWNSVFYTILPMVNYNETDAEDLTQEAFSKAFNRLDGYRPEYAFSTWLFRVAINNTIDFIRKKRLQTLSIDKPINTKEGDSMAFSVSSLEPDPEECIIKDQRILMVRACTHKLNPKYRKLIQLRYFKEYSYAEIAEEMQLPLGTVKAQLHRAKQLLQDILAVNGKRF